MQGVRLVLEPEIESRQGVIEAVHLQIAEREGLQDQQLVRVVLLNAGPQKPLGFEVGVLYSDEGLLQRNHLRQAAQFLAKA